jgi:hypothetical protein
MPRSDQPASGDEAAWINETFYERRPWEHFDRQLARLASTFRHGDQWRELLSAPVTIGSLRIESHLADSAEARQETLGQIAIEGVLLLHHVAETLLRCVCAHAPAVPGERLPDCPAIALARMRNFSDFKSWVRTSLVEDEAELVRCVRHTLGDDDREGRLAVVGGYVRRLGRHVLDADVYNAAKHGLAISGEHSGVVVTVGEIKFADVAGPAITWLDDRGPEPRWTTRWYSLEGLIALIHSSARLIEQLWMVGRRRYIGADVEQIWCPQPIAELWSTLGIDDLVLLEMSKGA